MMPAVYEYRFTRHRIAEPGPSIRAAYDAATAAAAILRPDDRESEALAVLMLNAKNRIIGAEIVVTGSVSSTHVRLGELFRAAVRLNATSIILTHNHPSGDPTPSPDDLHLTAEAIAAGRLLDIDVLDHLVLGADGAYVSLRDRGISFSR